MNRTYLIPILFVLATVMPANWNTASCQDTSLLRFPIEDFTLETIRVNTPTGTREVVYRYYKHIPYVSRPVDLDYQSMDVLVPECIDGAEVETAGAPILFNIGVGGYMSSRNVGDQEPPRMNRGAGDRDKRTSIPELALAAGYVVVSPGCRGRDNQDADGYYYGKAPAAIVDLKAAVRYIRFNDELMPGEAGRIVSTGCSAGGALSALLGTSGNSQMYKPYLEEIGAADAEDHILGSACFSPITDLEHADMAYEWMYGSIPARFGLVDQTLSNRLKSDFAAYQASRGLQGKSGFGTITADNYDRYLLDHYIIPSANEFLGELAAEDLEKYLTGNDWIKWTSTGASFSFTDYALHVGRMKGLPAFDDFDMRSPETILFGTITTNARHFTNFSLQQTSGNPDAEIDDELKTVVNLMNAMYFIQTQNPGCAGHWWIRNGTSDNHTSQTVFGNLVTGLENLDKDVDAWLYWDGGHCANEDPEGLIDWIVKVTGYTNPLGGSN